MSHVSGGLIYKRFLNALRGVSAMPPPFVCEDGPVWTLVSNGPNIFDPTDGLFYKTAWTGSKFLCKNYPFGRVNIIQSLDGGLTWSLLFDSAISAADGGNCSGSIMVGNGIVISYVNSLQSLRSLDGGDTFSVVATPFISTVNGYQSFSGGKFWYVSQTSIRSSVDGVTVPLSTLPALGSLQLSAVVSDPDNNVIICTAAPGALTPGSGRVLVSTNGGLNFSINPTVQPWNFFSQAPRRIVRSTITGRWVGVSREADAAAFNAVFYTDDLINWFPCVVVGAGPGILYDIAYQQGIFVAIGASATSVFISADGVTFERSAPFAGLGGRGISVDGNGTYVVKNPNNGNNLYAVGSC